PLRIRQIERQRGSACEPAVDRLDRLEDRVPGIDQRPQVSDERADIREADPPDDPHHRRRDVAIGVFLPAETRNDGDDEDGKSAELECRTQARQRTYSSEAMGAQLVARVTLGTRGSADEQSDNQEGDDDRNARARDIETERQRQIIALAETMRMHRSGERTEAGCSGRDQTHWPGPAAFATADRP